MVEKKENITNSLTPPSMEECMREDAKKDPCLFPCEGEDISPAIIKITNPCDPMACAIIIDCEHQLDAATLSIQKLYQERRNQCQAGVAGYRRSGLNVRLTISIAEGAMDCELAALINEGQWETSEEGYDVLYLLDYDGKCTAHWQVEVIPVEGQYSFILPWATIYTEDTTITYSVSDQRSLSFGFFAEKSPLALGRRGAKALMVRNDGNCLNGKPYDPLPTTYQSSFEPIV